MKAGKEHKESQKTWMGHENQDEKLTLQLQETYNRMSESIQLSEVRKKQMSDNIHKEIEKRRTSMRKLSGKKVIAAVALVAALAAGTAVGAGRIAGLSSSVYVNEVDYENARAVMESAKLNGLTKAVQTFEDGTEFQSGYDVDVSASDAQGNVVGTYPSITVTYSKNLFLDVSRPLDGIGGSSYPEILTETYNEIPVKVTSMDYLFLPPNEKPSEEDQEKEEAGLLEISYGSETAERKTFLCASWEEDGLSYQLMTFDSGHSAEEMLKKAKEIIDARQ